MAHRATRRTSMIAACGISAVFTMYAAVLFSFGREPDAELFDLYQALVSLLLVVWFVADTAVYGRFTPSFDYGWFVMIVFPVFAAYYLIATRRWRGLAIAAGMLGLFYLPWLGQWAAHYVS